MQTFLKPFTAFTSLAHTGNVAFDIGQEYRHAHLAEGFCQHL